MNQEPSHNVNALVAAATAGDFERLRALVANGADVNGSDAHGETVLMRAISESDFHDSPPRLAIARELLSLGADPRKTDKDGAGPIVEAAMRMETELLRLLMDAGAHPNHETGWDSGSNAYDLASEDYYINTWIGEGGFPTIGEGIPEEPSASDLATHETWLFFLDRMAIKYGKRRPDHLFLMRERGARTSKELAIATQGS